MGKPSKPNFPSPPSFQADPFLQSSQQGLSATGDALRTGKFMNPDDPTVGFLNQLVALNPEATQTAVNLASRDVIRMRDQAQQNILNELEANNQLSSSVTGNRLSDLNEAFSSDISDIASQFYLADVERSLANVSALFGTGLDTLNAVGGRGLQNQQQVNSFNQTRYGQEVALENERFQRQLEGESATAGLFGTFLGPGGGAIAGIAQGNPSAGMAGVDAGFNTISKVAGIVSGFGGMSGGGGTTTVSPEGSLNQRLLNANSRRGVGLGTPSKGGLV